MKKSLLEIAKEKGLIELKESFSVIFEKKDIEILETAQLFESGGKKYKSIGILKQVPITKYTVNLNNRVYEEDLWKRVKEKNMVEGSLALADHPKGNEEGSVKDIVGLWKNFTVNEKTANADLYLVGTLGETLLELVKLGSKIGFSTAGYGNLQEDNKTVDPNSYSYERCDWVLNNSQQVYATTENLEEDINPVESSKTNINSPKLVETSIKSIEKLDIIESNTTNKCESLINNDIIQENKSNEVITMDKIQEAQFRNTINEQVSKAMKNENLFEAVNDLKALDTADSPELKEKVESTMQNIQTKIAEKEATLIKELEENKSALTQITADHATVVAVADELKEKLSKVSSFIEQIVDTQEDFDSTVFVENYNTLITDHEKFLAMLKSENFKKYEIKTLDDFTSLMEDRVTWEQDIADLQEQLNNTATNDQLKIAETCIEKYEALLEKYGHKFDVEETPIVEEVVEEPIIDTRYKKVEEKKAVKEEEDEDEDEKEDSTPPKKKDDEDEEMEEVKVKTKKTVKKESVKNENGSLKYSFFDNSDTQELVEEDTTQLTESTRISNEIKAFYEKQSSKFPGIKDFKKEILESKSMSDAFDIVENIKNNPEEEMVQFDKLNESKKERPNWMPKGRI